MSDKQCSSCGGFCGRGGCKRENVKSEQKPICDKDPQGCWNVRCQLGKVCKNTTPPARKPLTDSEVFNLAADYYEGYGFKAAEFARAIERAHGIGEA